MISARLGDIVSEIYLLAAALKRFEDEGRRGRPADRRLSDDHRARAHRACLRGRSAEPAGALGGVSIMRLVAFPAGFSRREPKDALVTKLAEMLMTPGAQRDRLTVDLYLGEGHDEHPCKDLEEAFELAVAAEPAEKKMREADIEDFDAAVEKKAHIGR
jgi:acyl-CoA dehydrogenase